MFREEAIDEGGPVGVVDDGLSGRIGSWREPTKPGPPCHRLYSSSAPPTPQKRSHPSSALFTRTLYSDDCPLSPHRRPPVVAAAAWRCFDLHFFLWKMKMRCVLHWCRLFSTWKHTSFSTEFLRAHFWAQIFNQVERSGEMSLLDIPTQCYVGRYAWCLLLHTIASEHYERERSDAFAIKLIVRDHFSCSILMHATIFILRWTIPTSYFPY